MKYICALLIVLCFTAFADTILLKNGLTIKGDIISVGKDSVSIMTSSGALKIAVIDIDKIETAEPTKPEAKAVSEGAIPKSIKAVGYGCLGGIIGGGVAGILAVWTDGFGEEGKLTATIIVGSTIIGILAGVAIGGT